MTPAQFSPRSNLELYGTTVDLKAALGAQLTIAISPDWSPSGSAGMIPEMTYAWRWLEDVDTPLTAKHIVEMATVNPAALIGDKTGRIEKGYAADLLVVARQSHGNSYETLLETEPAGVKLVVVGGKPLYGDAALLAKVNPAAKMEPITVCGAVKVIDMSDRDDRKGITWAATRANLTAAMSRSSRRPSRWRSWSTADDAAAAARAGARPRQLARWAGVTVAASATLRRAWWSWPRQSPRRSDDADTRRFSGRCQRRSPGCSSSGIGLPIMYPRIFVQIGPMAPLMMFVIMNAPPSADSPAVARGLTKNAREGCGNRSWCHS